MKANAILYASDSNSNDIRKSLPNVNPAYVPRYGSSIDIGAAASIKSACQALNALTTNTFKSVNLEITEDVDNPYAKPSPNFSIEGNWSESTDSLSIITTATGGQSFSITNPSGGELSYIQSPASSAATITLSADSILIRRNITGTVSLIQVTTAETAHYAAKTLYALLKS